MESILITINERNNTLPNLPNLVAEKICEMSKYQFNIEIKEAENIVKNDKTHYKFNEYVKNRERWSKKFSHIYDGDGNKRVYNCNYFCRVFICFGIVLLPLLLIFGFISGIIMLFISILLHKKN
jgi:hypothetical protein